MKLTAILLTAFCLNVAATGHTQGITLKLKNAPLERVFTEIKKQTGYSFVYNNNLVATAKKVDLQVSSASIEEVLDKCFKDQPLTYTIVDKTIIVKPKEDKSPNADGQSLTTDQSPLTIDISGKITDADGNPLAGASIHVKGTNIGTSTDANGVFVLKGVDENATLEISFVGYQTQTISTSLFIKGAGGFTVELKRNDSPLDEIQIRAYGPPIARRINTSNQYHVTSEEIGRQPVSNVLSALYNVPGMFITQTNGMPGGGITIRIQGKNSIGNGNDPLYVIDGVPYTSQLLPLSNRILGTSGGQLVNGLSVYGNPLSYFNPADIESIDVLKDADATAIYGSRAANGAILITTKRGRTGKTKVDINLQRGWGKVTRKLDLLNTQQYLGMRREALANDGISAPSSTDYDINGFWDTTRYTDWQKELIGRTTNYTDVQSSISGGTNNTSFLLGMGYHEETTVFPGNFSDQKGSLHFNFNHSSTNQKFQLQFSGNYLIDYNRIPDVDLTSNAMTLAPDAPSLFLADGGLNWKPTASGTSTWTNPLGPLNDKYKNKTGNLLANLVLGYHVLPGLELRSSFGYSNLQTNETQTTPLTSVAPERRPTFSRFAVYGNHNINSWIAEPQIIYKKTIKRGKLEALVGTTFQQNNKKGQRFTGIGHNSDQVLESIRSASTVRVDADIALFYRYSALYTRVNYNWQDKYILNLTARRDGSSRFGANNQFHNFGSVGAAWIFSKEDFIQNGLPFLSFGKLKGSYGTTGNDQIGDYQFLNLYAPVDGVEVPYQGIPTLGPTGLPNPNLQWEETKKMQLGLDLGFLKDRVLLSAVYSRNRSSNQLLGYVLPIITGYDFIQSNFPATVQNTSWELSLATENIKSKNFSWNSNINLTLPKNKLVSFLNFATSGYLNSFVIGQPITITKVFPFMGVDPTTGKFQFADSHGNATFTPNNSTDKTVLINTSPTIYGGLQNSFRYKRFELNFLFQFVKQKGKNYIFGNVPGNRNTNEPGWVLENHWQKPGDQAFRQKYSSTYGNGLFSIFGNAANNSDAAWSDASYTRLKNLSLSWQLPQAWQDKAHLSNCRLYVQGQNLFTITKYKGLDPETLSSTTLPPLRVITVGLQIGL